jgi:hypothetical protein
MRLDAYSRFLTPSVIVTLKQLVCRKDACLTQKPTPPMQSKTTHEKEFLCIINALSARKTRQKVMIPLAMFGICAPPQRDQVTQGRFVAHRNGAAPDLPETAWPVSRDQIVFGHFCKVWLHCVSGRNISNG